MIAGGCRPRNNGVMFATTRWSSVAAARDPVTPAARRALADLCGQYWYPAYRSPGTFFGRFFFRSAWLGWTGDFRSARLAAKIASRWRRGLNTKSSGPIRSANSASSFWHSGPIPMIRV